MVCYEYLKEQTWLGFTYYTPEVDVSIAAVDGTPVVMTFEVDSGASITLAPRSLAEMTGVVFESGIPVMLSGVGGSTFTAYVHSFNCTIGEVNVTIPIAIAPTEDFPPLLGRLSLYDQVSVLMNNDMHASCIGEVSEPISTPSPIDLGMLTYVGMGVALGLVGAVMLIR